MSAVEILDVIDVALDVAIVLVLGFAVAKIWTTRP